MIHRGGWLGASIMIRNTLAHRAQRRGHRERGMGRGTEFATTDELVVEGDDLRPVRVAYVAGGGVHGVDRRKDLIATRSGPGVGSSQALAHEPMTLGDQLRNPGPTVLLVEGDQFAARRNPGGAARPVRASAPAALSVSLNASMASISPGVANSVPSADHGHEVTASPRRRASCRVCTAENAGRETYAMRAPFLRGSDHALTRPRRTPTSRGLSCPRTGCRKR